MFGNGSSKERYLIVDGGDIHFITGIGRSVVRDCWCLGLLLNISLILFCWILSIPFSGFKARTEKRLYIFNGSIVEVFPCKYREKYLSMTGIMMFSSSLWQYPCSCTHIMSLLSLAADAVNSVSWFILFKIQMLNIPV